MDTNNIERVEYLTYTAFAQRFVREEGKTLKARAAKRFAYAFCKEAIRLLPFGEAVESPLAFKLIAERTAKFPELPIETEAPKKQIPIARRKPGRKPQGITCLLPEHE